MKSAGRRREGRRTAGGQSDDTPRRRTAARAGPDAVNRGTTPRRVPAIHGVQAAAESSRRPRARPEQVVAQEWLVRPGPGEHGPARPGVTQRTRPGRSRCSGAEPMERLAPPLPPSSPGSSVRPESSAPPSALPSAPSAPPIGPAIRHHRRPRCRHRRRGQAFRGGAAVRGTVGAAVRAAVGTAVASARVPEARAVRLLPPVLVMSSSSSAIMTSIPRPGCGLPSNVRTGGLPRC